MQKGNFIFSRVTHYSKIICLLFVLGWANIVSVSAFESCGKLASITIPNSVTSIGESAFNDCDALMSITIGNSVQSIGASAFSYCQALMSITIPNSVISIGTSAFYYCRQLTSITIPNSVTSIGASAFYGCNALTSITIGNSVTTLENNVFYDCDKLTSVTIGNSVTMIMSNAFNDCSGLKSIVIPSSVQLIGGNAFTGCSSLTKVIAQSETPPALGSNNFNYSGFFGNLVVVDTLYVPTAAAKELYEANVAWKDAFSVILVGDGGITAIENVKADSRLFTVYPIPAKESVTVELEENAVGTLAVFDMNGRLVARQDINGTKNIINTSAFASGNYIVRLIKDGVAGTGLKFIKE
jgi:hypothetical protein